MSRSNWIELGLAGLIAVVLGGVASKWIIYSHPQTSSTRVENQTQQAKIEHNLVRTTRTITPSKEGPIVTVIEEKDLSTETTMDRSSSTSTSLSTPVWQESPTLYLRGYRDVIGQGWLGGLDVKPFEGLTIGGLTDLNHWYLGLSIGIK